MRGEDEAARSGPAEAGWDVLRLVKMHGCGNDYVFIDTIGGPELPDGVDLSGLAVELSDRRFGVGGDGLIVIGRAPSGRLSMRMFNADGSEGLMCGNGIRCLAAYVFEEGYTFETGFEVETASGLIRPEIAPLGGRARLAASVTVDMGPPREITPGLVLSVSAGPARGSYPGTYVSMGNPHFVVLVEDLSTARAEVVGPVLERHGRFPDRANIEFAQVLNPTRLRMRIWERGSGLTMASGTGAAAVLVAAVTAGAAGRTAVVATDGGELGVQWLENGPVKVTGPVERVFETIYRRPLPRLRR